MRGPPNASFISIKQMLPRYHGWQAAKGNIEGYNHKAEEVNKIDMGLVKEAGDQIYFAMHGYKFLGYSLHSYMDSWWAFDGGDPSGARGLGQAMCTC